MEMIDINAEIHLSNFCVYAFNRKNIDKQFTPSVMEHLVLGEEHGSAHGQSRQLGGGDGQPDAVDAQRQQENGDHLKRQRAQKEISVGTPSPSAVKKEDAYTLKPMMRKLSAYSRKARLVRASNSAS